MRDVKNNQKWG